MAYASIPTVRTFGLILTTSSAVAALLVSPWAGPVAPLAVITGIVGILAGIVCA